jgi:D-serine deaminase-like pyridoxal phosphate-dependent protein
MGTNGVASKYGTVSRVADIPTPALLVVNSALERNLDTMAKVLPGTRLRPHVKAHKSTDLARRQRDHGHLGFTVATIREAEGLHAAGLGHDLLLANEVLDARRLGALVQNGARVTLAVDSIETIEAAVSGGVQEVLIDVNIGLPRCGCRPDEAGELAALATLKGLQVRGVMGYEGHLMVEQDSDERREAFAGSMRDLAHAHELVGGEIVSSGGTGTYAHHIEHGVASEVQAGSYALMDSAYAKLGLPFEQSLWLLSTVISVSAQGWAVANCGLKSHGMDHGDPSLAGHQVWFLSDEHAVIGNDATTENGAENVKVGSRVSFMPAHVDPTVTLHEQLWLVEGTADDDRVLERWPVDLRNW